MVKKKDLPKISFYLSLVTPVFFLFTVLGLRVMFPLLLFVLIGTTIAAIVTSIVALVGIAKKKHSGVGYAVSALVIGIVFTIIWIIGFMFAVASMPAI